MNIKIITRAEAISQGLLEYFTGRPCKHGHIAPRYTKYGRCRACLYEATKKWHSENPEKKSKSFKKHYNKNLEHHRARSLKYVKDRPLYNRHKCAKRRSDRLQRTPKWADLEAIKKFYQDCPKGFHVDHIVPLKGRSVSGLHVLNNLQYLPALDNLRKKNKWEG